jgi:hypothetical protein
MLFIAGLFTVMLCIIYFLSDKRDGNVTFWDMIPNPVHSAVFFVLFGIAYPLVSFVKKDTMLVRTFFEERTNILNIFDSMEYELTGETDRILTFRLKSRYVRFMRLFYEDTITVEHDGRKVSLSGLRRDIYRLARYIEYLNRDL